MGFRICKRNWIERRHSKHTIWKRFTLNLLIEMNFVRKKITPWRWLIFIYMKWMTTAITTCISWCLMFTLKWIRAQRSSREMWALIRNNSQPYGLNILYAYTEWKLKTDTDRWNSTEQNDKCIDVYWSWYCAELYTMRQYSHLLVLLLFLTTIYQEIPNKITRNKLIRNQQLTAKAISAKCNIIDILKIACCNKSIDSSIWSFESVNSLFSSCWVIPNFN